MTQKARESCKVVTSCKVIHVHVFWTLLKFWWSQFVSSEVPCFLFPTWTWVLNTRKDFCKMKPASMFFHFENCQTHVEQFTHLFDWQVVWIFKKGETVFWKDCGQALSFPSPYFPSALLWPPRTESLFTGQLTPCYFVSWIFESFMIQLGRPFWLQGGCMCTPYTPLPSRAC